jgi:hypothetical protein
MISVLARESDHPVVQEFFELFKTPWRFHTAGAPAEVLLCSAQEVPPDDAALVIVFAGERLAFDEQNGIRCEAKTTPGRFQWKGVELPIYGCQAVQMASQQVLVQHGQAEGRPFVRVGFDLFAEVRHLLAEGQPVASAGTPTLEQHIAFLRELILSQGLPLVEIPPRPAGHEFIACLTHDVDHVGIRNHKFDHTMFGFLYRATAGSLGGLCAGKRSLGQLGQNLFAALRLPLVHLGLARDFWYQFDQYTALEAGRPSTFFVIPKKGETGLDAQGRRQPHRAASYDAADLRDILRTLEKAGKEVSVHGLDAWRDSAAGRAERGRIGDLMNHEADGIRMHWLYFDAQAPEKLEAAGYAYDSTMGYNQTVGYRSGGVQVFKPLNAQRLLELPMHIMDTALFFPSHLNLSPKQAAAVVRPLIENSVRFGGVLTINWHDRSLAPERLWGGFYEQLLGWLQAKNPWFASAAQTVAWFRQRRAAIFETTPGGNLKIKLPAAVDGKLPPLRVRVTQPGKTAGPAREEIVHDGWETGLAATVSLS